MKAFIFVAGKGKFRSGFHRFPPVSPTWDNMQIRAMTRLRRPHFPPVTFDFIRPWLPPSASLGWWEAVGESGGRIILCVLSRKMACVWRHAALPVELASVIRAKRNRCIRIHLFRPYQCAGWHIPISAMGTRPHPSLIENGDWNSIGCCPAVVHYFPSASPPSCILDDASSFYRAFIGDRFIGRALSTSHCSPWQKPHWVTEIIFKKNWFDLSFLIFFYIPPAPPPISLSLSLSLSSSSFMFHFYITFSSLFLFFWIFLVGFSVHSFHCGNVSFHRED